MFTKNTFVAFLDLLEVKHTKLFSEQYFNEHPHKYNLYGLSKMLTDYGIENVATRIADKENDITEIEMPFIAHFGGDFVVVYKVECNKVSFFMKGSNHILPVNEFLEAWQGIVLLAESSEKSIEPDYNEHRKTNLLNLLKKTLSLSACGLIIAITCINQSLYTDAGISLLLLINLAGMYISWLLLLKQMKVQSQYADKICSLFKQKDCNNVLESEGAKLFGIIGWSEIGFGYFSANVLLLLFSPSILTFIVIVNILTLPFTLWSVWYQHTKAKQWCVLCLIVLVLLWSIFIVSYLSGYIQIPGLNYKELFNLIAVGCCYFVSILGINMFAPKLNSEKAIQSLKQSINSMKADESVFTTLLKKQPFYETNDCDSIIRFGNSNSPLKVTVFSNPYCNPCAMMHKRIEELLLKVNNKISIQYILSSFEEKLNTTNKYLIAVYLADNISSVTQIINDWFESGKALGDEYFKNFSLDMENSEIETEFQRHESWKKKTGLRGTPTILVNGYQLPESYKIEDLRYFIDLDI
jgi:uncharacterized membrane protein